MRVFLVIGLTLAIANCVLAQDADINDPASKSLAVAASSKVILKVENGGGLGVGPDLNKSMVVFDDGRVECQYWNSETQSDTTYYKLGTVDDEITYEIRKRTRYLKYLTDPHRARINAIKTRGTIMCADDPRRFYSTGDRAGDTTFKVVSLAGCGIIQIHTYASHYLEGLADGFYFQCPQSPSVQSTETSEQ